MPEPNIWIQVKKNDIDPYKSRDMEISFLGGPSTATYSMC